MRKFPFVISDYSDVTKKISALLAEMGAQRVVYKGQTSFIDASFYWARDPIPWGLLGFAKNSKTQEIGLFILFLLRMIDAEPGYEVKSNVVAREVL